jgi:hypothetical protein
VEEVAAVMLVEEAMATTTIMVAEVLAALELHHHKSSGGSIKVGPNSVTQTATGANGQSISSAAMRGVKDNTIYLKSSK